MAGLTFLAVAGVTVAGALATGPQAPGPGTAQVRLIAEAAPASAAAARAAPGCPVRLAAGYLSASSAGRVGGDLYEVVTTPECVRLVAGDARGKGLPAVQSAAAVPRR